jgi:hypothetical protein
MIDAIYPRTTIGRILHYRIFEHLVTLPET